MVQEQVAAFVPRRVPRPSGQPHPPDSRNDIFLALIVTVNNNVENHFYHFLLSSVMNCFPALVAGANISSIQRSGPLRCAARYPTVMLSEEGEPASSFQCSRYSSVLSAVSGDGRMSCHYPISFPARAGSRFYPMAIACRSQHRTPLHWEKLVNRGICKSRAPYNPVSTGIETCHRWLLQSTLENLPGVNTIRLRTILLAVYTFRCFCAFTLMVGRRICKLS